MAFLAVMALATAAVTLAVALPPLLRWALPCAIAALCAEAMARVALLRGRAAVRRLWVQRDGRIEVESPSGARRSGTLQVGSFVAPWLTIVRWRPDGARFDATVLLLPDMAEADALRRLRVLLRWA